LKPIIAIVPSAGIGRRFGKEKVFIPLMGEPLIYWSINVLHQIDEIVEIIPVLREEQQKEWIKIVEEGEFKKIKKIASGGKERQESVYNALMMIDLTDSFVMIHDGARPLVSKELLKRIINAMDEEIDGVIPVIPVKDTIKEINNGIVVRTLKRDALVSVQTPQLFRFKTLKNAYIKYKEEFFTDDASVVEKYGGKIKVIPGEYKNIKITTPEDIIIAETFLTMEGR